MVHETKEVRYPHNSLLDVSECRSKICFADILFIYESLYINHHTNVNINLRLPLQTQLARFIRSAFKKMEFAYE